MAIRSVKIGLKARLWECEACEYGRCHPCVVVDQGGMMAADKLLRCFWTGRMDAKWVEKKVA